MGILYVVATPIGNLDDISLRAIETIMSTGFIACEDTRKTGILLNHLNKKFYDGKIKRQVLISYYEQNELRRIPEIINILKEGKDVVLVSDAGTPTISDPGFKLVREAVNEKIRIESVPGPSSIISSLVSSGLPTDKFIFFGFLPQKKGHQEKMLKNIKTITGTLKITVIFFVSPHKLINTLQAFMEVFGDINIVIARELTKKFEEIRREPVSCSIEHFKKTKPKGEIVVLFRLE